MFVLCYAEHFHDLYTVLGRVSVKVIIEDSKSLLCILLDLCYLWNPILQLLLCVTVIVPGMLAVSMPSDVSDRRGDVNIGREERFVDDTISGLIL